ncbi:MAG: protein kinase [Thermoanaerobaculia bacterium]|jgi:Tol biopolymer transport system component
MELAPRTRLGPYEIVSPLGAGGMGEVYKARDTRLDRDVAIKVLPAELAHNTQFKLRFEREAKTISQLNHPHICTLHDIGEENGLSFLVMELVDGTSLADLVSKGPLPAADVLRYGTQIAEALSRAHRSAIIHRDLKPGNVMITKGGAKLLDFGLAKSSTVEINLDEATQQKPLTTEGTILGTFQYMSPEQLEGQEADARTDIFALGAVLYEMATGRRAFEGKTKTSLIAAIVKEQPRPIAEVQPLTPPALQHVVDKCLAKDPDDRWQSALDVASELRWISSAGSQAGVAAPITSARARRSRLLGVAAVAGWAIAIAALVATVTFRSRLREASRVTQSDLAGSIAELYDAPIAVSPDGRRVALEIPGRASQLSIRDLSNGNVKLLAGTEGASYPFWAPDGHALGFFAGGKLKTVNAETGAIQTICDAPYGRGGTWSANGVIVFAPNIATPIVKVGENGGTPVAVTKPEHPGADTHRNPAFLPDGTHFLYCSAPAFSNAAIGTLKVGSIDGTVDRKVLDYASNAAFVNGWLLTVKDRNLIAQRFDPGKLAVEGKPVAIAQNIDWYPARWTGAFAAGADTLVYHHGAQPKRQFLRLDPGESRPTPIGDTAYLSYPAVSPDGRRVIVDRFDPATISSDLWMVDLAEGGFTRMTFSNRGSMEESALFSPDGERVAMTVVDADGEWRSLIQPAGGGTQEALRAEGDKIYLQLCDWLRDGTSVLVSPQREKSGQDIEIIHLDGDRKSVPVIHGASNEDSASLSPNGKWLAYRSDESGRYEIYVTNYPAATAKWQVSTTGGTNPQWSADGQQLLYLAGDRVVAAAVREGASFSAESAKPLDALGDHIQSFGVSRSGRIVALREIDPGQPPLTIVRNWTKLLGRD